MGQRRASTSTRGRGRGRGRKKRREMLFPLDIHRAAYMHTTHLALEDDFVCEVTIPYLPIHLRRTGYIRNRSTCYNAKEMDFGAMQEAQTSQYETNQYSLISLLPPPPIRYMVLKSNGIIERFLLGASLYSIGQIPLMYQTQTPLFSLTLRSPLLGIPTLSLTNGTSRLQRSLDKRPHETLWFD